MTNFIDSKSVIIIGAGGLATQIFDVLNRQDNGCTFFFYDDYSNYQLEPIKFGRRILISKLELLNNEKFLSSEIVMGWNKEVCSWHIMRLTRFHTQLISIR